MTQRQGRPRLDAMDLVSGDAREKACGLELLELLELKLELELEIARMAVMEGREAAEGDAWYLL